jgi:hypothetical protein
MPVDDRSRWKVRAGATALAGALFATALLIALPGAPAPRPVAIPQPFASTSPCPGSSVSSSVAGQVADAPSGSSAPPIANQSVLVGYRVTQTFHPQAGGTPSYSCLSDQIQLSTGSTGDFNGSLTIEGTYCERPIGCWNFSGPYGPVTVGLGSGALPAGYFLDASRSGTAYVLTRVLALDSAAIDPSDLVTVSVDAPTIVAATGLSGIGSPSPATLSYGWSVQGSGWRTLSPLGGPNVTVEALSTAFVATVTAWVNGTYGGATLHAGPTSVLLTAAATQIQSGAARPTSVDVGIPATFSFSGTGAPGYVYQPTIDPGLGLPAIPADCTNHSISGDLLQFDCSSIYEYPITGSAQPFGTLSNPFSAANYSFAPVTVSAGLVVTTGPASALAYAGGTVDFTVAIASGTGTPPYGPACLTDGIGATSCQSAGGPPWTFAFLYPQAGAFGARASVADSGGTNYTAEIPVTIAERPTLSAVSLGSYQYPEGGNVSAVATLTAGAFPISYWWNTSCPESNVGSGTILSAPPPLTIEFPAPSIGPCNLTFTAVDALGTHLSESAPFRVVSTEASAILLDGAPSANTTAGRPVGLDLEAVDVLGGPVPGFNGSVAINLSTTDGPAWVNASLTGPAQGANGLFVVNGSAWRSGYLNLTVAEGLAGVVNITVRPSAGPTGPAPIRIVVLPDIAHERLTHPDPVRAGERDNATRYEISDPFGNPVPGGWVLVRSIFGGLVTNVTSPIEGGPSGSFVWVNYTAPSSGSGVVYVLSESGEALLPPISVPALPANALELELAVAAAGIAVGALAFAVAVVRRRRSASVGAGPPDDGAEVEDGLKRLAEGRGHVLDRVPFDTPVDLDHVALGWIGTPPDAAELAEWVGSLVAEGALKASIGPGGRPMFVRVRPAEAPRAPRVEVDSMALDAALERARFESDHPDVVDEWDDPDRSRPPD